MPFKISSFVAFVFLANVLANQAIASDYSYTGAFTKDDDTQQFNFTLAKSSTVVVRSLSYAGGNNSAGAQISRGGFDTTLSLFDLNGNLVAVSQDGQCGAVAMDALTSFCWDAYLQAQLPAGSWMVVLTQSENLPNGPTLADGFAYQGMSSFTAGPQSASATGFWDLFPSQRTGAWAVDIIGADSVQTPLNPKIAGFVSGATFLNGNAAPNMILSLFDAQLNGNATLTLTVNGEPATVLYAGASQINFVIPADIPPNTQAVVNVMNGPNLLLSAPIAIASSAPGLFTDSATGTGQAAALNVLPGGGLGLNGSTAPATAAARGSYVAVYGTGFGQTNAPDSSGLSWLSLPVTATVGGVPATVQYAGLVSGATNGLQQVNVLIPDNAPAGPSVAIAIQAGASSTQSGATLAIQ